MIGIAIKHAILLARQVSQPQCCDNRSRRHSALQALMFCSLTDLVQSGQISDLLVASHILPWSTHESERLNVRNGICINRLHDAAFDQGLIAFDDECQGDIVRIRQFLNFV